MHRAETFELYPLRFCCRAGEPMVFPAMAANTVRGAFGSVFRRIACVCGNAGAFEAHHDQACIYAKIFEPKAVSPGPSGFVDRARPFVLRTRHLDGRRMGTGEPFHIDVNLFWLERMTVRAFVDTFAALGAEGIGAARARFELESVTVLDAAGAGESALNGDALPSAVSLPLEPSKDAVRKIRVEFVTPTELKSSDGILQTADFAALWGRARDRIGTLRSLYGAGPISMDYKASGERAGLVRCTRMDLEHRSAARRSTRTGETHPLGGFTGWAEYEGELSEFVPFLEAARWTGVGRQTVWGKGEIAVERLG